MTEQQHHHHGEPKADRELTVYAYPDFIYVWPVIFLGFLFWILPGLFAPTAMGWIYLTVTATVMLTLGVDLHRNASIFWMILLGLFWFFALWLRDAKGVTIFDTVLHYFGAKAPDYNRDFGFIMSIILSIIYCIMIIHSRLNDRWRFTHNEIEHYIFGRSDRAMARGAKQVTSSYPNLLELLLTLGGSITVFDARGREKLGEIHNVPLLPLKMKHLNKILETTSVVPGADDDEADENDDHGHEDADDQNQV